MFIVVFTVGRQQRNFCGTLDLIDIQAALRRGETYIAPSKHENVYYGACCRFSIDKYDLDMFPGLPDAIAGLAGLTREQLKSLGDIQSVEIKREI